MELTSDWKTFRSIFYPRRRALNRAGKSPDRPGGAEAVAQDFVHPVFAILDESEDTVIAAYSESEDLSDWLGAAKTDFYNAMGDRKVVFFGRGAIESSLLGSVGMPHFLDQLESLRATSLDSAEKAQARPDVFYRRHFFLEGVRGWWSKVLPSAYGVFIRLEGQSTDDILVLVRQGRVESYGRSDLSSLGLERGRDPEAIIKYLSEKHMVPVQGLFVDAQSWQEWMDSSQPWRKLALSIRTERARMVPFRWSLVTLIAGRGFLGL